MINMPSIDDLMALENATDEYADEYVEESFIDDADESAIVISSILESMGVEEGLNFIIENAQEMYAYGLISDADYAMEAAKNIVKLNKDANLSRETSVTAIRLARNANDPLYKKYRVAKDKYMAARAAIHQKYGAKAKSIARKTIANSKRKASTMNSKTGAELSKRMDKQVQNYQVGKKNNPAIAK